MRSARWCMLARGNGTSGDQAGSLHSAGVKLGRLLRMEPPRTCAALSLHEMPSERVNGPKQRRDLRAWQHLRLGLAVHSETRLQRSERRTACARNRCAPLRKAEVLTFPPRSIFTARESSMDLRATRACRRIE